MIDGYRFSPDRVWIFMGENGDVFRFVSNWNTYERLTNVTIVSPEKATQQLECKGITLENQDEINGPANVNTFEIIYIYPDPLVESDIVVPTYFFTGDIQGVERKIGWHQYIPAIADSILK